VLTAADDGPRIAAGIEQILGLGGTELGQGETLWASRRFVETIALERPLILAIEDIHWAEPTFLDLLEGIADWSRDASILLVCSSRPEILETRPTWGGGKLNATSVMLRPLSLGDTSELIENLLGRSGLAEEDKARIADAAEGNPLFVEQMVSMLIDEGTLVDRDGTWSLIGDLGATTIPTSIHTLLAARLDGLPGAERALLERAAVIGREFDAATLEHLSPEPDRAGVRDRLRDLVRKDMIRPDAGGSGDESFRFRHVLIRNAAYESMPKRVRAELHERVADLMEATHRDRFAEYEEIVGHHLERAATYLTELGAGGENARDLARRAGERLASAGTRAFARGDMPGAVALMSAATSLLPTDDPTRVTLLPDLGTALVEVGQMDRADEVFAEAIEAARARDDLQVEARALLYRFEEQLWSARLDGLEVSRKEAERLIAVAEERSDDLSLSWLWRIKSVARSSLAGEQEASDRAMAFARRAGDVRGQREILQFLSGLLPTGPMPVPEALARSEEFLEIASGDRVAEAAVVVNARSTLLAMAGRIEESRAESARARDTFRALGLRLWLAASGTIGPASAELLVGELGKAEGLLREAVASLEAISEQGAWLSVISKMLVVALSRQGRVEDATRSMALVSTPRMDFDSTTRLQADALILHHSGRPEEAEPLFRRSLELADPDALPHRGNVLMDLAETLRALGREDEALLSASDALALFERKGDVVSAERARAFGALSGQVD
jgi:tetratricopeptide (TPR) repeat protein